MIIPTPLLAQIGLEDEAEVSVEDGALVVRAPARPVRSGWGRSQQSAGQVW
jgi:antitoxin MazE